MSEYRDDYIEEDDASQEELPITYPIICTNVPDSLLDVKGVAAREHFEKFGYVAKILLRPAKKSCVIEYENRDGAERAILNAGAYDGFMFNVTWNKNRRKPKVDNDPEWLPDPDVEAELKAMSGGDSRLPRVQRQKKMEVERPAVATPPKRPVLRTGIIRKKTKAVDKPKRPETPPLSTASFQPIDREELRTLITRQWLSALDKLKALEIRDKIIRSRLSARKGAIQGCCPDMCSEKERLLRETQRQIASYEFDDETGNLDPKKAVKQYSRSSADQEEPLAHELRPILVLKDTLLYLLHHIIDTVQDESGLGEWFHFMWDRLRAIRKDITQQNLTCKGSVALVESCARFHAHCAARLVEEPPSSFDQRLNTENLSKCLQSLKYMYGDLRAKGQIDACKREPEFRAYVILLNMNDANFMWEVQRLDPTVLSSPEVRFAIKVFTAIDNNNYIQFFKLVKETTYLNACILLRYFNHVRARALHRIIKTYSPRGTSHFPAQELIDMLGFENLGSMELFLENYGLQVISDQDSSNVVLNKTTFHDNDTPAVQERAINMVESKLQTSLAEIIYGGSLPPSSFYDYEPHSSFNSQGYFNKSALLAQDQGYSPRNEIVDEVMNLIDNLVTTKKPSVAAKQPESNLLAEKKPSFVFTKPDVPTNLPQSVFSNTTGSSLFMKQQDKENDTKPFQKSGGFVFSEPAQSPASIFGKGINEVDSSSKPNIFKKPSTVFDPTKPPPSNPFGASIVFSGAAMSLFGVSAANDVFKKPSDSGENIKSPFSLFGNAAAQQLKTELQEKEEEEKRKLEKEIQRRKEEEMRQKEEEVRRKKEEEDRKIQLKIMEEVRKQEELKRKIEQEKRLLEEAKRKVEEDRKAAELAKQKLELDRLEKERKRKELEIRVEERLKTFVPEIIEEVLREECMDLSKEAMEWSNSLTESAYDVVNELIKEICLEECAIGVRSGKKLQEIRLKIICRSTVKAWKKYVGRSRLRRLLLHTTPTWLPTRPLPKPESSQMSMLQKMKDFHRRKLPILKISEPNQRETINLFKTVKRTLFQQSQSMNKNNPSSDIYWKVVLSTPDAPESNNSLFISKWMSSLFSDEQVKTKPNHVLYLSDNRKLSRFVVSACNVEGDNTKQPLFSEKITGWSGILFYGETKCLQRLSKRIDTLMSSKCPYEKIPIAIVLVSNTSTNNTLIALENTLELYKESRALDYYKIFQVKEMKDHALCPATKAALNWLATHIPLNPCIKGEILSTFLDNCLGSELWYRFNLGLKSSVRKAFESIEIVSQLYNESIDKIIDIACNKSLLNYPLFAPEFKDFVSKNVVYPVDYQRLSPVWKNNFDALRSLLNSLKIKTFYTGIWPPANFQSLQESLTKYVQSLKWFRNPKDIVLKILNEVQEENIENKSYAWLNVMNNLVKYKIAQIIIDLNRSEYKIDSHLQQFLVVYQPDDLYSFRTTPWWYSSKYTLSICPELIELPPDEDSDLEYDYYKSSKKMKFNDKLEESQILEEKWLYNVLLDIDTSISERVDCNNSIFKLNEALELEKQKQDEFKNFLQAALDEG